jgi:hypothetical protein
MRDGVVMERTEFLSLVGGPEVQVRDRSGLEASERKTEWVSDEEIEAAVLQVVEEAFSISVEEAGVRAMGMMGFRRRTLDLQDRVTSLIENGCEDGGSFGGGGWLERRSGVDQ